MHVHMFWVAVYMYSREKLKMTLVFYLFCWAPCPLEPCGYPLENYGARARKIMHVHMFWGAVFMYSRKT